MAKMLLAIPLLVGLAAPVLSFAADKDMPRVEGGKLITMDPGPPPAAKPPTANVPGTGGKAVFSTSTPPAGNPGNKTTVAPTTIDQPGGYKSPPTSTPGVGVTIPIGGGK